MSLNLNENFYKKLQSNKPIVIGKKPNAVQRALGMKEITELIIPPLNTDIGVIGLLPSFSMKYRPALAAMEEEVLPLEFDLRKVNPKISKPPTQYKCGSCWAVSTASAISDCYLISGLVSELPNISATWSLACFPQKQCNGGNPADLLKEIENKGIMSKHCVDYSWCALNKKCNGKSEEHFDNGQTVSDLIPPCGCYDSDAKHLVYKIHDARVLHIGATGVTENNVHTAIKKHIFKYGPVLGLYVVFKNFLSAEFIDGVYLERYHKNKDGVVTWRDNDEKDFAGGHAVCIIGWGVQKNLVFNEKGEKADIPYWICRNSWSEKWNKDGYFKIAMYPYNKISQFESKVIVKSPNGLPVQAGGILTFLVNEKPYEIKAPEIPENYRKLPRLENDDFYKGENGKAKPVETEPSEKKGETVDASSSIFAKIKSSWLWILLIVLIILIIIAVIVIFLNKRKYADKVFDFPENDQERISSEISSMSDLNEIFDPSVSQQDYDVRTSSFSTPSVSTPSVRTPSVSTPSVRTPSVSVSTPSVRTPSVSTPSVSVRTPSLGNTSVSTPVPNNSTVRIPVNRKRTTTTNNRLYDESEINQPVNITRNVSSNNIAAATSTSSKQNTNIKLSDRTIKMSQQPSLNNNLQTDDLYRLPVDTESTKNIENALEKDSQRRLNGGVLERRSNQERFMDTLKKINDTLKKNKQKNDDLSVD